MNLLRNFRSSTCHLALIQNVQHQTNLEKVLAERAGSEVIVGVVEELFAVSQEHVDQLRRRQH